MRIIIVAFLVFTSVFMVQCNSGKEAEDADIYAGMEFRTRIRMRQYMVQGQQLYQIHCANCHGDDGKGLGKLIPPLAKADYFLQDLTRAICISRNGIKGSMLVNNIEYNQQMPDHKDLTALEIAEIITYASNSWGNVSGLTEVKEVEAVLNNCK
ncbi:MAG: cytochrome c [Cyclobacteriaceae bacterium]